MIPITYIIIAITCAVSFIAFKNRELLNKFLFNAYQVAQRKEYWRLFSNGLIHGGTSHLFMNMFVLWMFGTGVEQNFEEIFGGKGTVYFILLYVLALFFSSLPSLRKHANNPSYNSLGASGATSAVLFSYIVMQPLNSLYLFFIPIPIPAFLVGIGYLFYENYMGKKGGTGIGHDAHFSGAVFGALFTIFLKPELAMYFVNQILSFFQNFFA